MSKIVIKKDFKNGDKLYDVDLNNNFMVIEAGVNANEENLEEIIEEAEARLTAVFEDEASTMEAAVAADNLATKNAIIADNDATEQAIKADNDATEAAIIADNDATEQAIKADNDATEAAIIADNAATVEAVRNLVVEEGWDWGGTTTERVRFFKGDTSAVSGQSVVNGQLLFDLESGIISLDDNNSRKLMGGALWDEIPKKPVKYKRKTSAEIEVLPIEDGSVIYNTENGKQYMDIGNQRIPTGGAGGEVILEDETVTDDTKLILEDEDLDFQGLEIANERMNGSNIAYSCDMLNGIMDYSTEEINTHKVWIDGKPIYRKVINFGSLPNATGKSVAHNINNVDKIWIVGGFATNGVFYNMLNLYVPSDASGGWFFNVGTTNVSCNTGKDRSDYSAYVILEYTKTS